MSVESWHIVSC